MKVSTVLFLSLWAIAVWGAIPIRSGSPEKKKSDFHYDPPVDECAFIRERIAALPDEGGTVEIPPGRYVCAGPIVIDRSHVTLTGVGLPTLRLADSANAPLVIMGSIVTPPPLVYNIEVSNLILDGNMENQQIECWGGSCDAGGTAYIRNNGITIRGVQFGRVKNVSISKARSGGIVTEKNCRFLKIEKLTSTDNFFDGLAGYETSDSVFEDLDLSYNRAAGISLDIRFDFNTIRNSKLVKNGDVGIFMRDSDGNRFQNLQILESRSYGIFLALDFGTDTCAFNNTFDSLRVVGSWRDGFRLNNACTGNRLTGRSEFLQNLGDCISEGTNVKLGLDGELICER